MIKRYLIFVVGLFIASLGVAFSAKAGLGTSPVSAVPYSISLVNGVISFGWWLNILSIIQISVQVILTWKKCKVVDIIIQTVLAFVYGYLTDFSCYLIRGIVVETYIFKFVYMLLGCLILAIGIWIQYMGGVAMLPGEAMNRAIASRLNKKYENVKIVFDVLYIATATVICLIFIGRLEGVREGSIIAALLVGSIIKVLNKGYRYIFMK